MYGGNSAWMMYKSKRYVLYIMQDWTFFRIRYIINLGISLTGIASLLPGYGCERYPK